MPIDPIKIKITIVWAETWDYEKLETVDFILLASNQIVLVHLKQSMPQF